MDFAKLQPIQITELKGNINIQQYIFEHVKWTDNSLKILWTDPLLNFLTIIVPVCNDNQK